MMAKLNGISSFKTIHAEKDSLALLKMIKGLVFRFDGEKEFELSLVEANDKLHKMYQTKEMTNVQFRDKFNNLIDVIEHFGGTVGVHRKVTEQFLAAYTDGIYEDENWRTAYTDKQVNEATQQGREKILARMFLTRADRGRYGSMMAKLQNDYITGRKDVYPDTRIEAFLLLNNWNSTYDKGSINIGGGYNGSSFTQEGGKGSGIACWGCGKEGIVLSQCTNTACIKRYKIKQEKMSVKATEKGEQHINVAGNNKYDVPKDDNNANVADTNFTTGRCFPSI
jgi:hypothetical protein